MDKTFLTLKDVADNLGVSEKTIYRMLTDNQIPFAVKIGGQWRFRADAMADWISGQRNPGPEAGSRAINSKLAVGEALHQGAVLYRIHGHNRDEAIDELLSAVPYSASFDREALKVSILARESLVSSSLAGIAYMGISGDKPVFFEKTMILLAFLEDPMDFKSLDGVKTEAIFLLLPANFAEQALVEMKLRRLSMEPGFGEMIKKQLTRKELLAAVEEHEEQLFRKKKKDKQTNPQRAGV